jgi:UDP-N-acetylglucosamine 2-epimerase
MILHIVGARPQFIKLSPLYFEFSKKDVAQRVLHTGQHFDNNMSDIFTQEISIDYNLGIHSLSHGAMVGRMIESIESVLLTGNFDLVIVYGDTNSTLAGAIAAKKLGIKVAHIESGLRSFDNTMPEEINRILVDRISDFLFCSEETAYENLINEGMEPNKCNLSGNIAIDSLRLVLDKVEKRRNDYYLCTLHRPFNIDDPNVLHRILSKIDNLDKRVILPRHPRLNASMSLYKNIEFLNPLGYVDFITYLKNSSGVITDSGGIQCESVFLKIPIITLRPNTEHVMTLNMGNKLLDKDDDFVFSKDTYDSIPDVWDGKASSRIVEVLLNA